MLDNSFMDELDRLKQLNETMQRRDYILYIKPEDSISGEYLAELQKLRQDLDQYVAEQSAQHAAEEQRHKLAERRQFWQGVLAGAIGSTVAGLIVLAVQNWLAIFLQ